MQAIIKEEGERHQRTSREWVETVWADEGISENTEGGMEYIEFSQEVRDALFQAGRNNVLPKWVERTGGPRTARPCRFTMRRPRPSSASEWAPTGRRKTSGNV